VLNQSLLETYDTDLQNSQLPCGPIYDAGYSLTVEPYFQGSLNAEVSSSSPADVVFALDDSGSMGGPIGDVRTNTKSFVDKLPGGSRVGLFAYADGISGRTDLTTDADKVVNDLNNIGIGGSDEPEDRALKYGINEFSYDPGKRNILIILATEPADVDSATSACTGPNAPPLSECVMDWAENASQKGITVYTIADQENLYEDIAEETGGKYYHVTEDFSKVFDDIAGEDKYAGGGNTCTLPPVERYDGKVDLVFAADSSKSYEDEWDTVCSSATKTKQKLKNMGINVSVSLYSPGRPEAGEDSDVPMNITGDDYNHTSSGRNVPECVGENFNDAVSSNYGKGITEWDSPSMPSYDKGRDSGYEGWGAFTKWIIENHDWRSDTDYRAIYSFGDHLPTGGKDGDEGFMQGVSGPISNETELVENISGEAAGKNIVINTLKGDEWNYTSSDQKKPYTENDAMLLMREAASSTSGEFMNYTDAENIRKELPERFKRIEGSKSGAGFCSDLKYSFGQEKKEGKGSVVSYPVSIKAKDVTSPGNMRVNLFTGDLAQISGQLRKIIDSGKSTGENVSKTFRINLGSELETTNNYQIEKSKDSTYKLTKPFGGDNIKVSDQLTIGVNGDRKGKFSKDAGSNHKIIDFGPTDKHFEAYKGAYFQHIVINRDKKTKMQLDAFDLKCTSCTPSTTQEIVPDEIDASKGSQEYKDRGGIGVYEYNSTEITIGETEIVEKPAICIKKGSGRRCNTFDTSSISPINLEPGNYLLNAEYKPNSDELVIRD
jgi:hypothetical protein